MNNKKNIDDYFDDNFEVTYTGDLPSIPVGQDDYDDRYDDTDYLNDYETDDYYDETDRLAPDYDDDYEAKLHLVEKFMSVKKKVHEIDLLLENYEKQDEKELIKKVKKLSGEIIEEL